MVCILVPALNAQDTENNPVQNQPEPGVSAQNKNTASNRHFIFRLADDQKTFWTSGKDLGHGGAKAFFLFASFTGLLIASDSWITRQVPDRPNQLRMSRKVSDLGVFSLVSMAGGSFLLGKTTDNEHWQE